MSLDEEIKEIAKKGDYKKIEIHIYKQSSGLKNFFTYVVGTATGVILSLCAFLHYVSPKIEQKIDEQIVYMEEKSEEAFKKNLKKCMPELIDDAAKYIKDKYYDKSKDAIDEILEEVVKKIPQVIDDYIDNKIKDLTNIDTYKKKFGDYLKSVIDDLLDSNKDKKN